MFDNLIHKGEMPVTIGIFVNPGHRGHRGDEFPENRWRANNRSYEYDSLGDQYARFLLEELLPAVGKKYNLSTKAEDRAICGASSGGICAFTAAWERPDAFSKVYSMIGSFTNIRGGNIYPSWIRKTAPKPIRVFLEGGENDLNNSHGDWPLGNLQMAAALKHMMGGRQLKRTCEGHDHAATSADQVQPEGARPPTSRCRASLRHSGHRGQHHDRLGDRHLHGLPAFIGSLSTGSLQRIAKAES